MWEAERGGKALSGKELCFRVHGKLKALLTTYSRKAPISGIPVESLPNNVYIVLMCMLKLRPFLHHLNPMTKKYFHLHH